MKIKLVDAIQGNRNWEERTKVEIALLRTTAETKLNYALQLEKELEARREMVTAMEKVQALIPENETITFFVPDENS